MFSLLILLEKCSFKFPLKRRTYFIARLSIMGTGKLTVNIEAIKPKNNYFSRLANCNEKGLIQQKSAAQQ